MGEMVINPTESKYSVYNFLKVDLKTLSVHCDIITILVSTVFQNVLSICPIDLEGRPAVTLDW